MNDIKTGVWLKHVPSPAHTQGTEPPYPNGWGPAVDTSTEDEDVSVTLKTVAFAPQNAIVGVWMDTDEPALAELLHPRGERLARDAGLDPETLKNWSE